GEEVTYERTREKRGGESAPVSKSELCGVPCGAQWEPSRRQRYHCRTCKTSFGETQGRPMYALKTPAKEVAQALLIVMRGGSLRAAEEITGHKYETISVWLKRAATHAEALTQVLARDLHLSQVEIDEFWSFVHKKRGQLVSLTRENAG